MNNIKLKTNHIIPGTKDYLSDYLSSLGTPKENIFSLLNGAQPQDEDDAMLLNDIEKGIKLFQEGLVNHSKFHIVVDSDCDGYTSAAQMVQWLQNMQQEVTYSLHPGKEHGIVLEDIPETDIVIVPDAGTNDLEQVNELVGRGKKVLIIDHHIQERKNPENANFVILNNQISPNFPNKYLSGAGMVNIFLRAVEKYFHYTSYSVKMRDLAAVGIIADAMNMTSLGNNFMAFHGLANINNKFLQALAAKQAHGIKDPAHLTKIDVAFYIAPVINGVIRSGTALDKEMVFRAMWDQDNVSKFSSIWRGIERLEDLYNYAARLAVNAKNRQDAAKKKSFEWLCEDIRAKEEDKYNLLIAKIDTKDADKINPNITGLIAMELVKEFNRPTLVIKQTNYKDKLVYGGSGRNGNFYGLPNLMKFLNDSQLTEDVVGHNNAFGVFINEDNIDKLREYSNIHLKKEAFDKVYEVDYWFAPKEKLNKTMLMAFAEHDDLYGNSIPQPKFAIDRYITKEDVVLMGKDKSSIKINCGEISLVAFKNYDWVQKISSFDGIAKLTIVGRPQLNEWRGKSSIQIIIDDLDLTCDKTYNITSPKEIVEDNKIISVAQLADLI